MWLPDCIGPRCSSHERRRQSLPRRASTLPQLRPQSVLLLRLLLVQLLAGTPLLTGWRSATAAATAAALIGERSGSEPGTDEVPQGSQVQIAMPLPDRPADSGSATQQNVAPDEEGTTAPPIPQQQHQRLPPRTYPETAAATTEATVAVIYAVRVHELPDANASRTAAPGEATQPTRPTPVDGRNRADDETPSGDGESDDDGWSGRADMSAEAAAEPEQLRGPEEDQRPAAAAVASSTGTMQRSPLGHETAADLLPPLILVGSELGADKTGDEPGENATIAVPRPPDEPSTVEPSATTEQAEALKKDEATAAVRGDATESAGLATRQASATSSVQQLTAMGWAEDEDGGAVQLAGGPTAPQLQAATPESAAADDDDDHNDRLLQQQQPHDDEQSTVDEAAAAERSDRPTEPNTNGLTLPPETPGDSPVAAADDTAASDDPAMPMKDGYDQERSPDYTALPAHSTDKPHFAPPPIATDSAASDAAAATTRNKSVELPSLQGKSGEGLAATINRDLPSIQGAAYPLHYPPRSTDFNDVSQASIVTAAARNAQLLSDVQLLSDATVTASDTAQASRSDSSSSSSDCCSSSAVMTNPVTKHSADAIARNASAATNATAAGMGQPLNVSGIAAIEMTQPPQATFSATLGALLLDGSSAAEANEMRTTASTTGATDSSIGASGSSTTAQPPLLPLLRGELNSRHSAQQQLQDETTAQAQERSTATIASMSSDSNAVHVPAGCHNVTGCNKHLLSDDDDSDRATSTASLPLEAGYGIAGDRASMPRTGSDTGANDEVDIASARPPPSVLPAGSSSSIHRLFAFIHTAAERYHNFSGAKVTDLENKLDVAAGDDSSSRSPSASVKATSGSSSSTVATELTTSSAKPSTAPAYATSTRTAVSPSADLHHYHLSPPRGAAKLSASTPRPSAPQPLAPPASTTRKSPRPPSAAGPTTVSEPALELLRSKVSANGDNDRSVVAAADESLQPLAQPGIQRLQAAVELRTTAKPQAAVASPPRAAAEDHASTHGAEGGAPADPGTELDALEVAHGDGASGNGSDGGKSDAEHGWAANGTVAGIAAGSAVTVCLVALGLVVWLVRRRSHRLRRHRRQRRHRGKGFGGATSTGRRGGCRRHEEQDEREARYALHQTEHSLLEDLVMLELAKARSRGYVCDSDKVNYDEVFNLNAAISNQMITEL